MSAAFVLARATARRRLVALVGLAVVLAVGTGVSLAALEAARRTDQAYPTYLRRTHAGQLVVNPSMNTARAEELIASTPGIESYTSDLLLTAGPDPGTPITLADIQSDPTQTRFSRDGRYTRVEQPVVHEGRLMRSGPEAFVNDEFARAKHIRVGDTIPLVILRATFQGVEPTEADFQPIGRTPVKVVGIGVFGDEVLVDGLYPRWRILVTPDVAAPFDCFLSLPGADDPRSYEEITATASPSTCSTSHRFFSLRVRGGDRGVAEAAKALQDRFAAENELLPAGLRSHNVGFEIIPTVTADERARVQSSLKPAVRALQLFGVVAGVATLIIVLLAAVRIARREETDARVWRQLGAGRAVRVAGVALPLVAASIAGLAASIVVGWLASGNGPVASARDIEPAGRLGLAAAVVVVVVGAVALVLAGGIVLGAVAATRRQPDVVTAPPSRASRAAGRTGNPSLILGVRAAVAGAGSRALLAAAAVALTAVLATLVFSTSLNGLVSNPQRFGWPYDVAAVINYGYGSPSADGQAIRKTFDRPEVRHWGAAVLSGQITIEGHPIPSVAARPGFDAMHLPLVDGNMPVASDEIALGRKTADLLHLHVGSKVRVASQYGEREATVRGLVVLPPVGPFQSDRTSLGTGAFLSAPFFDAMVQDAEREQQMAPGQLGQSLTGFVAADLQPGVTADRFLRDVSDEMKTWDPFVGAPFVFGAPVRPATIANVAAMRSIPAALAGLLAVAMALGLLLAMTVSARARRRELAVFRVLGGIDRQLRATLQWQSLAVVVAGLVVGIPVGLAAGRIAYRAFANSIGVEPSPELSPLWLAGVVVVSIAIAVLAAVGPGLRATRVPAAEALRTE